MRGPLSAEQKKLGDFRFRAWGDRCLLGGTEFYFMVVFLFVLNFAFKIWPLTRSEKMLL